MRILVVSGLVLSLLGGVPVERSLSELPGPALGSTALLIVERSAALFLIWMFVLVVVAEAWNGRLPTQVSGQGVRYADAEKAKGSIGEMGRSIERHEREIEAVREEIFDLKRLSLGRATR